MSKDRVTKEQIADWCESPVTELLAELAKQELEDIQNTPISSALVYGEPTKTQENLVDLEARELAWVDLVALLGGDWSQFEEEEEDEE